MTFEIERKLLCLAVIQRFYLCAFRDDVSLVNKYTNFPKNIIKDKIALFIGNDATAVGGIFFFKKVI